ncbi:hypothetical protein IMCC12053_535 [Celeribacter marinus]|uniref:Uncharacterized protein n=1 Tax=Celeribacter marinus TaxID=1397108 RepID=A0A0P0A8Y1_9RHOB|nr:hypothetical protein IMCC12053_535 [Celeribacter marinus]
MVMDRVIASPRQVLPRTYGVWQVLKSSGVSRHVKCALNHRHEKGRPNWGALCNHGVLAQPPTARN